MSFLLRPRLEDMVGSGGVGSGVCGVQEGEVRGWWQEQKAEEWMGRGQI